MYYLNNEMKIVWFYVKFIHLLKNILMKNREWAFLLFVLPCKLKIYVSDATNLVCVLYYCIMFVSIVQCMCRETKLRMPFIYTISIYQTIEECRLRAQLAYQIMIPFTQKKTIKWNVNKQSDATFYVFSNDFLSWLFVPGYNFYTRIKTFQWCLQCYMLKHCLISVQF